MARDPTYPFLPVLCLVTSVLNPLTLAMNPHLMRNVGIVCFLAWLFLEEIIRGVNTIVWANDTTNRAPI